MGCPTTFSSKFMPMTLMHISKIPMQKSKRQGTEESNGDLNPSQEREPDDDDDDDVNAADDDNADDDDLILLKFYSYKNILKTAHH